MKPAPQALRSLRIAVEGCGHGTLDAIYSSVKTASEARGWDDVDLLIIGGDFQAVRNAADLTVMSCPVKYRQIGDFHHYYSGAKKAPYLTIFIGGNHEASSHLRELFYGGWAAPNIYYMGAANVVRLGGVRIAGMSGIWKGYNYRKPHFERIPFSQDDVRSFYHVREYDVRKLLQLRTQVDIGISHDWPTKIERNGDERSLFSKKPDFEQESRDGTLGSKAAAFVMDRLRPPYWFAAHMHCRFAAVKTYDDVSNTLAPLSLHAPSTNAPVQDSNGTAAPHNADEIDLNENEDETMVETHVPTTIANQDEIALDEGDAAEPISSVPPDLRAQLPAAFMKPLKSHSTETNQPPPPGITNRTVRFLALDKCLPGRKFLQLLEVVPRSSAVTSSPTPSDAAPTTKPKFEYDAEWLAITRVFASELILAKSTPSPQDQGEAHYLAQIQKEESWVDENVVKRDQLTIPENFETTAPPFIVGTPEIVNEGPQEYNNPQTQQFCDLVGIENKFFATEDERLERMSAGPAPPQERRDGGFGGRGGERGGRGGHGHGRGGGRGRGRGRRW